MKSIFTTFLMSFLAVYSYSQPLIQWEKTVGGTSSEYGKTVCMSYDSSAYYIACYGSSIDGDITSPKGAMDLIVLKMSLTGTVIWLKNFGGTANDFSFSIKPTDDNGVILGCFTQSNDGDITLNKGICDIWLIKLNDTGNIEWQKTYGGSMADGEDAVFVKPLNNGGYLFTANVSSNDGDVTGNHGGIDVWLVEIDSVGNIVWQKTYGGTGDDVMRTIYINSKNEYILTGYTNSNDGDVSGLHGTHEDFWVIKTDSVGNIIWQKCLGGAGVEVSQTLSPTYDSCYVIVGYSDSTNGDVTGNHGEFDAWVVKINDNGIIQWEKSIGGTAEDFGLCITHDFDNGYLLTCSSISADGDFNTNYGEADAWVVKLDDNGQIIWKQNYGGTDDDRPDAIIRSSGESSLFTGFTKSNDIDVDTSKGMYDIWMVKLSCALPSAQFYPSDTTICEGTIFNLLNQTFAAATLEWYQNGSFVTDSSGWIYNFNTPGNDTIILMTSYGACGDTNTNIIITSPAIHASYTPEDTTICANTILNFNAIAPGATDMFWYLNGSHAGASSTYQHSFDSVETDTITFIGVDPYCSDTVVHYFDVIYSPSVILGSDSTIYIGDSVLINAANTGADFLWSTGDSTQTITVFPNDTIAIWVAVTVGSCTTYDTIIINVIDTTVGIYENQKNEIRIFPNPASEKLNIILPSEDKAIITILSIEGREIYRSEAEAEKAEIDISMIPSGLYQINILQNYREVRAKIIILSK